VEDQPLGPGQRLLPRAAEDVGDGAGTFRTLLGEEVGGRSNCRGFGGASAVEVFLGAVVLFQRLGVVWCVWWCLVVFGGVGGGGVGGVSQC